MRPENVYLVFGWRVSDGVRNSMMAEKGEDAREAGITLTISSDGKSAFIGNHLGTLDIQEGYDVLSVPMPGDDIQDGLEATVRRLGFELEGPPILYAIAG